MVEYEAKFTKLERFAPGLVAANNWRRFSTLVSTTMAVVVRAASRDERIYQS